MQPKWKIKTSVILYVDIIFSKILAFNRSTWLSSGEQELWAWYQQVCVPKLLQLCLTLCDPMDCSPPGSSVHGILRARILEWVVIPFSKGSSQPRESSWPRNPTLSISCIGRWVLYQWCHLGKPQVSFGFNALEKERTRWGLFLCTFTFRMEMSEHCQLTNSLSLWNTHLSHAAVLLEWQTLILGTERKNITVC